MRQEGCKGACVCVTAGTPVAVKMLVCQHLTSDVVKEFRAEVAVLSALRHPNVILFMGACTVSPHLCIVTELAPRGSLWGVLHGRGSKYVVFCVAPDAIDGCSADRVLRTRLVWRTVMKMIVDTARGMAFLHSAKPSILHRDLKVRAVPLCRDLLLGTLTDCTSSGRLSRSERQLARR